MKRFLFFWGILLLINLLTVEASNLGFKHIKSHPSNSNFPITNQPYSEKTSSPQDSGKLSFKSILANYLNPFVSVGIGFDRVLFVPAIGIKSGRLLNQISYLDYNDVERFTLHTTYDFKKPHATEKGFFRLSMGLTYNWQQDVFGPVESYGLLSGFSLYQWNGRTSMHGKVGIANRFSDLGQIKVDQLLPVASLSFNFYLFRNDHVTIDF